VLQAPLLPHTPPLARMSRRVHLDTRARVSPPQHRKRREGLLGSGGADRRRGGARAGGRRRGAHPAVIISPGSPACCHPSAHRLLCAMNGFGSPVDGPPAEPSARAGGAPLSESESCEVMALQNRIDAGLDVNAVGPSVRPKSLVVLAVETRAAIRIACHVGLTGSVGVVQVLMSLDCVSGTPMLARRGTGWQGALGGAAFGVRRTGRRG